MMPYVLIALVTLSVICRPAFAAEAGKIAVELNDLQQADSGCRAIFVMRNGLASPLDKVAIRIVTFDSAQHATRFLSLDVGPLPVGKTRVLRFELGEKSA